MFPMGTNSGYGVMALVKLLMVICNTSLIHTKDIIYAFLKQYIGVDGSLTVRYDLTDRDIITLIKVTSYITNSHRGWAMKDGKIVISRIADRNDIDELSTIE